MFNIIPLVQSRMQYHDNAIREGVTLYAQERYSETLRNSLSPTSRLEIEERIKANVYMKMSNNIYKHIHRKFRLVSVEADLREFDIYTWVTNGITGLWSVDPSFSGESFKSFCLTISLEIIVKRNYVYNEQARILQPVV